MTDKQACLTAAWTSALASAEYHRKSKHIHAGMAVGLVSESGLVHSQGWGSTNLYSPQEKVTVDHVFRIGSISKLFTDIAVMRLVEAGKLDLDSPICKYISLIIAFQLWQPYNSQHEAEN